MSIVILALMIAFYSWPLALFILIVNLLLDYSWEGDFYFLTLLSTIISVLISILVIFSLLQDSIIFFSYISPLDFFLSTNWSPQFDGNTGTGFGFLSILIGTIMISIISISVAFPLGLATAIYLVYYSPTRLVAVIYPVLNLLAIIPTIVYGLFAIMVLAPFLGNIFPSMASDSALVIGLTIGIMTVPLMITISFEGLKAVNKDLYKVSYSLGANQAETLTYIILPAAWGSILNAGLLAFSRAIGETMIVVMIANLKPEFTLNPMAPITTISAQIVNLLTGDLAFNNPILLSAFALGLMLCLLTMLINVIMIKITNKYYYDSK